MKSWKEYSKYNYYFIYSRFISNYIWFRMIYSKWHNPKAYPDVNVFTRELTIVILKVNICHSSVKFTSTFCFVLLSFTLLSPIKSAFLFLCFWVAILGHIYSRKYTSYIDSIHKFKFYNSIWTILNKTVMEKLHIYRV